MTREEDAKEKEDYSLEVIRDLEAMRAHRTEWNEMASKQADSFPFLGFDWFSTWIENFLQDEELWVVLLYEKGILVCIAPFLKRRQKMFKLSIQKFELIGNVYSPFRNFLFRENDFERRKAHVGAVLGWMAECGGSWDVMDLAAVPEERDCFAVIPEAVKERRLQFVGHVAYGDWYVDDIDCSGDEFIQGLPKKIRRDVSYCLRRLQKEFAVEFKVVKDSHLVHEYMSVYYDVYAKSWQKTETVGPHFHRDFAEVAARQGWLRLGFLFAGDKSIAAQFWISSNGTSYILKTVYDLAYRKYSPGKVLTAEMVKYAIDVDRVSLIDYVQGDEPYKKDWTPKRRERKGITIFGRSLKGRTLDVLIRKVRPAVNENAFLRRTKESAKRLVGSAEWEA